MLTLIKFVDYYEPGNYDIPLDEFEIPDWWFRVHRLHRDEVDLKKVTDVRGVVIGSCSILRENIRDTIEVSKIEFYTDNTYNYLGVIALVSLSTLLVFIVLLKKRTRFNLR